MWLGLPNVHFAFGARFDSSHVEILFICAWPTVHEDFHSENARYRSSYRTVQQIRDPQSHIFGSQSLLLSREKALDFLDKLWSARKELKD